MVPTRAVRLLLVALSISSATQALQISAGMDAPLYAIEKREPQASSGDSNNSQTTSVDSSSSTSESTTEKTTTTTTPSSTPDPTTTASTSTTTPEPPKDPTTTPSQTPTEKPATTKPTSKESTQDTATSAQLTPTTSTTVTVVTVTGDNGETKLSTSQVVSTGLATISKDGNGTSGMSTSTRNTIIGVVVGVGGAIILCAVGVVALRISKRKRKAEENDGLIGYGGYAAGAAEKPDSLSGPGTGSQTSRTPFQSTLESYHAPTQVNQASNF